MGNAGFIWTVFLNTIFIIILLCLQSRKKLIMKKLNFHWFILWGVLLLWGCSDGPTGPEQVKQATPQKQFVWNAMNYWYYWQADVSELGDNYFESDQAKQQYLREFSDAKSLFEELIYEQEDDFSFFIENYATFEQSQKGISKSFGFEYGLVRIGDSKEIFGYVQYVLPGSPADDAGLVRGDLFLEVNGTQLTDSNYRDLLLGTTSYELSLAEIQNNNISLSGDSVSLEAVTLQENPIFTSKVIDTSATQVGYLMYNAFQTNSHRELNDVFSQFQSQGIDELVLDLRYNGGGSGITSQLLSSLISAIDSSKVFAEYAYSDKRSNLNRSVYFLEEVPIYNEDGTQQVSSEDINSLGLQRLYVLADYGTASASEVLINGLEPYIDVVLIGGQTVGKDQGSYTLYDAPPYYLEKENANPDHKIAIQPIVLKVVNANGEDYPSGFKPDHAVNEINFLEGGLPPLGDPDDPLLAKALELITGNQQMARTARAADRFPGRLIIDSRDLQPYAKGLYLKSIAIETPAVH